MHRILLLLLLTTAAHGQTLGDRVNHFASRPELHGAQVAINVIELGTGQQLAAHQAEKALIPASTLKLVTTAAALDLLGSDHQFITEIATTHPPENGTLRGDVLLIGGGDPTLGSPYMDGVERLDAVLHNWTQAISAAGIKRIEGRVVGDGTYFGSDGTPGDWPWADLGNYYGAGTYGLNLNENSYKLVLRQRPIIGAPPVVLTTRPAVRGLEFYNELVSGPRGSGDQAYIYAAPFSYQTYIRGSIPVGTGNFTIRGSIPDPALFAAQLLDKSLREAGIEITRPPETASHVGSAPSGQSTILARYPSPPLTDIVDRTNLRSLNLYAETLLREINKSRGRPTRELSDPQIILDWLDAQGINTQSAQILDGSGLSPRNFVSPELLTSLLKARAGDQAFRNSIPLAGKTGSMRNLLKGRTAAGRLWAKSGSVNAVRCYAGYATGRDGRELAFAIMVNNYTMKSSDLHKLMLELMNDLCEAPLPR